MAIENLTIKCDAVTGVVAGAFREPEIVVTAESCDIEDIIKQLDTDDLLNIVGEGDVISFLEDKGYQITEAE